MLSLWGFKTSKRLAMNQIYVILLCVTTFITNSLVAQTGPGGVGNSSSLILWLKADDLTLDHNDEVNTWYDVSGNAYNASDQGIFDNPYFSNNYINSGPAVRFDGIVDELGISLSASSLFGGNTQMSFFNVVKSDDASDHQGILRKAGSIVGIESAYSLYIQDSKFTAQFNYTGSSNKVQSSVTLNDNQEYILGAVYNGNLTQSNRSTLYIDGTSTAVGSVDNTSMVNTGVDITIGSHVNFSLGLPVYRYLNGGIGEMIIYNNALNLAERTIVNNYLSSKHGIAITDDYYSYDNTHGENVIGIGQASDGSNNTSAQGSGIFKMYTPDDLDNGEYLFVGHNELEAELIDTCDSPGEYSTRLARIWKVNETGDVGEIAVDFDLSSISGASSSSSDYALIISSTEDFKNAVMHVDGASINSNTLTFTNVSLDDGDYFTLAMLSTNTIKWDGSWANGSGTSGAPGSNETDKKVYIDAANAQINSDALCGCLVVNSGDLTIASGKSLTVENTIHNDGTIEVENSSSLIQSHEGDNENTGSGNYIIYKTGHSSTSAFNIWSSPVDSTELMETFSSSNPCDMYVFKPAEQLWSYDFEAGYSTTCNGNNVTFTSSYVIDGGDGVMDIGRGYFIPGAAGGTRQFNSTNVNNGDISINVYTGNHSGDTSWTGYDWNLIGNPYPSAVDIEEFWTENAGKIRGGVYFWDDEGTTSYDSADYACYNSSGGISNNSNITPNGHIASCQGVWVIANSNTTLNFTNAMRSSTNDQFFKRSNNDDRVQTWFSLNNEAGLKNQLLIAFSNNATLGYDMNYDAVKEEGNPSIAFGSLLDTFAMAIQGFPHIYNGVDNKEIGLYFRTENTGDHSIQLDMSVAAQHLDIYLEDKYLNKTVKLSEGNGEYHFTVNQPMSSKDRFSIKFTKKIQEEESDPDLNVGIEDINSSYDHDFTIIGEGMYQFKIAKGSNNNPEVNFESVSVYAVDGTQTFLSEKTADNYQLNTSDWSSSLYIVIAQFEDGHTTSKRFYTH